MEASVYEPKNLRWKDGPPSLPPGAKVAVLEGDPGLPGPFVMRAKLPDGYTVPPHTHPRPERVTVISGTFYLGMGAKFDKDKGKEMPAGAFGTWPAGMKHFAWAKGETVIQVHGDGPWMIHYLNPDDDPRNRKNWRRRTFASAGRPSSGSLTPLPRGVLPAPLAGALAGGRRPRSEAPA